MINLAEIVAYISVPWSQFSGLTLKTQVISAFGLHVRISAKNITA